MIDKDIDEESVGEIAKRQQLKRKSYHRHSPHQIQQMEEFFRDCPHPNKKQRNELSQDLGMEPLQVKFWFQNKRTIMKAKHEHQVNTHLRVENDKLRSENMRYKEALENACCPACGFVMTTIGDVPPDERHLRIENARLREEIHRISAAAAKYVGKPITIYEAAAPSSSSSMPPLTDLKSTEKKAFGTDEDCEKSKNSAPSRMETKK